jgi:hypothetical protein
MPTTGNCDVQRSWVARLADARPADGAWAYRARESPRVEPTAYGLLAHAAHGIPPPAPALAWLLAAQRPDGAWGGGDLPDGTWVTALAVHALAALDAARPARERAVAWLLGARSWVGPRREETTVPRDSPRDVVARGGGPDESLLAWPWVVGCFGWVEPTAHALLALRAAGHRGARRDEAARFLADRRCRAGGWNHGVTVVRDVDMEPYPYTTAVALAALAPSTDIHLVRDLDVLSGFLALPLGAFDLAWIAIALDACGRDPGPALARLHALPEDVWRERVHALGLAAVAAALPRGTNPFRLGA